MRIKGLDLLRGLAVILVLFRHSNLGSNPLKNFGWLGVDLFFVLSGFLVSGLVFSEYKNSNKFNAQRFLVRRGLKILPPFYFFAFASILLHWYNTDMIYAYEKILSEMFFLQSYLPGIWLHTWSLSIEFHFYILFALAIFIVIKTNILDHKQALITLLITLIVASFFVRFYTSYPHRNVEFFGFVKTHLRSDGILIGVLVSYLFHFTDNCQYVVNRKRIFFLFAIMLILPGFYFSAGSFFMNTIGLSFVNIGFGIITLLSNEFSTDTKLFSNNIIRIPFEIFCFIGVHSYSIYLWHLVARSLVLTFLDNDSALTSTIYILFSVVLGILLSYMVEKPFMKLRSFVMS